MSDILAKPKGNSPITLQAHTAHVVEQVEALLDARPFMEEKYLDVTARALRPQVLRVAEWHDVGKRHRTWQTACRKDREEYLRTGSVGRHLLEAQLRHEFASLWQADREKVSLTLPERAAIAAHHGKLGFAKRHQRRWLEDDNGRFKYLWKQFVRHAYQWQRNEPNLMHKALKERYRIAGVRAVLQLADTRASRAEANGWLPPIEPFRYAFPYACPRGVQQRVKDHWDERVMILRAPTGSGKTDAAMLWAEHQIEEGRADRLVIAMPTRFTSTALAINVGENVGDTGLYHSSAWYARYQEDVEEGTIKRDNAQELHRMARLLMTPVTVCTIDHLCIALTGAREDHHAIFFNLMNACLVIDEADFYDSFVQANILTLLEVLRLFDVPVLVMSATVPESAKKLYGIDKLAEDLTDVSRTRCYIRDGGEAETADDAEEVLKLILEADKPTAIVYANTVMRALMYYDWFVVCGIEPVLYHSRFTEPDKKRIEEELINALGREAWENGVAEGVAILTQIGEMSLNISAPLMISELCPYDRLAQRAGRLSRFEGMEPGELFLITPLKNSILYPAPYGEYLQKENRWEVGRALKETYGRMRYGGYSAQDFVDAVNELYPEVESFDARTIQNQRHLHRHLCDNWLIVPASESEEDDTETQEWRSRDIPTQKTVLTQRRDYFESYAQYRNFELEYGVECSMWQIRRGKSLGRVTEVSFVVGDEEETVLYSPVYSRYEGLILDRDRPISVRDAIM